MQLDQQDLGLQAQHVSLFAHLNTIGVIQIRVHPALVAEHNSRRESASSMAHVELGGQGSLRISKAAKPKIICCL